MEGKMDGPPGEVGKVKSKRTVNNFKRSEDSRRPKEVEHLLAFGDAKNSFDRVMRETLPKFMKDMESGDRYEYLLGKYKHCEDLFNIMKESVGGQNANRELLGAAERQLESLRQLTVAQDEQK